MASQVLIERCPFLLHGALKRIMSCVPPATTHDVSAFGTFRYRDICVVYISTHYKYHKQIATSSFLLLVLMPLLLVAVNTCY